MKNTRTEAYRMGFSDLNAAASRYGTTNLTPSMVQREDWAHAWSEYMAGWKAAQRREVAA